MYKNYYERNLFMILKPRQCYKRHLESAAYLAYYKIIVLVFIILKALILQSSNLNTDFESYRTNVSQQDEKYVDMAFLG